MRRNLTRLAAAALSLALLTGCGLYDPLVTPTPPATPTPTESAAASPAVAAPVTTAAVTGDGRFSLSCSFADGFDPLYCKDEGNRAVISLVYEGLFRLTEGFGAEPVLCESWDTEDSLVYSFQLKRGVYFHDGTELNAADVVYTLEQAMAGGVYKSRLDCLSRAEAADVYTVKLHLKYANTRLTALLDIPMIKSGSAADPVGTGAYRFSSDGRSLREFRRHRDYGALPVENIYLLEPQELTAAFASGEVDVAALDMTDSTHVAYGGGDAVWDYDTTTLHYLGFNARSGGFFESNMARLCVSYSLERATVTERLSGFAVETKFPVSPRSELYDTSALSPLEALYAPSVETVGALATKLELADSDADGWLEYKGKKIELDFVVNQEGEAKVAAAEAIAERLRSLGFDTVVRRLSFDAYAAALRGGDFDLYYGETRLAADFNSMPLLCPGGSVNYSGASDPEYQLKIRAWLAADEQSRGAALYDMCFYIAENCLIAPLAFKRGAVTARRGVVAGLSPTQGGVFGDLTKLTINLGQ